MTASDDGVNDAGGNDASALGGRPGRNPFNTSASCTLTVRGGYIFIDANGDGLDINGPITMSGGAIIVNGSTENMNGAIDCSGSFELTSGVLIAVGGAGMAQGPTNSLSQSSAALRLGSMVPAGALVHIESTDGEDFLTFLPTKAYQSIVLSTAELLSGTTYDVYIGGQATGTSDDGLYTSGDYTPGTLLGSFTL